MRKITTKLFPPLLAAAILLVPTACGKSGGAASGDTPRAAESVMEPLRILFSTTYNETETGGKIISYFIDRIEERSGGAVTVNINWGGTLFDSQSEFDAVSDGAVNMIAFGHAPHTGTLNYMGFPMFAPGGTQGALGYFNELLFENTETAALIQKEAEQYNIKYLNIIAGGTNAFCAAYAFTDLNSLVANSKSFGNMMAAQWEALGFQVTGVTPPDAYDALNRGLIDSTQMALTPMVALAWYEVAPYWALDGTYTAGNMFTVSLDWWNGLSQAQQDAIQAAADATEAYSATIYDEAIASDIALVEEKTGHPFVQFNQADMDRLWASCFEASAVAALANARKNGKEAGMVTVLEVAAKFTGYAWRH
jgi:TRAP-type C4-dicarboxylate transport system substrate-binding protein